TRLALRFHLVPCYGGLYRKCPSRLRALCRSGMRRWNIGTTTVTGARIAPETTGCRNVYFNPSLELTLSSSLGPHSHHRYSQLSLPQIFHLATVGRHQLPDRPWRCGQVFSS